MRRRCCVRCTDGNVYVVEQSFADVTRCVMFDIDHGELVTVDGVHVLARHVVAYWMEADK